MKKVILLLAVLFTLASCSSGWSCKKRYVEMDYSIELLRDQKTAVIVCNSSKEIYTVPFNELQKNNRTR